MITHLKFASIPCLDQARALAFWTDKMGFRVETDQPMGLRRWIELSIKDSPTRIVLFTPEGQEDRVGTFFNGSFACEDVAHSYKTLTARGVEFEGPPDKQPWGTFAKFKDPDGNTFVLSSR